MTTAQQQKQSAQQEGQSQLNQPQKIVDTLIIGGGPAALGILINAMKTNRMNELVQGDGLAIIDSGVQFGGGVLDEYGINSNTSGGGFLKCCYKKQKDQVKLKKKAQIDPITQPTKNEKLRKNSTSSSNQSALDNPISNPYAQNLAPSEKSVPDVEIYHPLKDLYNSHISKVLQMFGKNTAPLGVIGCFLNYAGNHLLSYIWQTQKRKIFFPLHKAVSVQLLGSGEVMTKVRKMNCQIKLNEKSGQIHYEITETDQIVCFRSKNVVICNGGVQGLHPDLFKWFPNLNPQTTIPSDWFLRPEGYKQTMKTIKQNKLKKIVIIGGSHSGFSCAWMLMNGPSVYYNNNVGIQIDKEPEAQRKYQRNCPDCCICGAVVPVVPTTKRQATSKALKDASSQHQNQFSPLQKQKEQKEKAKCECICKCFGLFQYKDWKFNYQKYLPLWEEASIQILYRDHIRVFYNKVTDAEYDGYTEFEAESFSRKDGYLYSFTGLRGDAKDLYLNIMKGGEKRVKLIQAVTAEDQRPYVEDADIVIWACGYQTNKLTIKDIDRKKLELSQKVPYTQYDVDSKCRVLLADGCTLTKVFACGIAFPIRTKDGMVSTDGKFNARADSFSLYMNFIGKTILSDILPKSKFNKNNIIHRIQPQPQKKMIGDDIDQAKAEYQQSVKERIRKYRKGIDQLQKIEEKQTKVMRHKSLNSREEHSSKFGRHQNISNVDPSNTLNKNQAFEFKEDMVNSEQTLIQNLQSQETKQAQSVDRALKIGTIQNKLSQMAKSPQLLQRKQHLAKIKLENAGLVLNHDLMPYLQKQYLDPAHEEEIKLNETKGKSKKEIMQFSNKSPYKANKQQIQQQKFQNKVEQNMKQMVSAKDGRDIMRSSHQVRKQDSIQQNATGNSFKVNKSQNGLKGKKALKHQFANEGNAVYNPQFFNSMGNQLQQELQSLKQEKLTKIKSKDDHKTNKIEFPPILHPLSQNHYVQQQQQEQQEIPNGYAGSEENNCEQVEDERNQQQLEVQQKRLNRNTMGPNPNNQQVLVLQDDDISSDGNENADNESGYDDGHFEADEDVSSEGSCRKTNSKHHSTHSYIQEDNEDFKRMNQEEEDSHDINQQSSTTQSKVSAKQEDQKKNKTGKDVVQINQYKQIGEDIKKTKQKLADASPTNVRNSLKGSTSMKLQLSARNDNQKVFSIPNQADDHDQIGEQTAALLNNQESKDNIYDSKMNSISQDSRKRLSKSTKQGNQTQMVLLVDSEQQKQSQKSSVLKKSSYLTKAHKKM